MSLTQSNTTSSVKTTEITDSANSMMTGKKNDLNTGKRGSYILPSFSATVSSKTSVSEQLTVSTEESGGTSGMSSSLGPTSSGKTNEEKLKTEN